MTTTSIAVAGGVVGWVLLAAHAARYSFGAVRRKDGLKEAASTFALIAGVGAIGVAMIATLVKFIVLDEVYRHSDPGVWKRVAAAEGLGAVESELRRYVTRFPNGKHQQEASRALSMLEQAHASIASVLESFDEVARTQIDAMVSFPTCATSAIYVGASARACLPEPCGTLSADDSVTHLAPGCGSLPAGSGVVLVRAPSGAIRVLDSKYRFDSLTRLALPFRHVVVVEEQERRLWKYSGGGDAIQVIWKAAVFDLTERSITALATLEGATPPKEFRAASRNADYVANPPEAILRQWMRLLAPSS